MLEDKFGGDSAFREFYMHILLNDTWTSEADERPRLSNRDITQHCKTGRYSASGRVRQQAEVREFRLTQFCQRRGGFGHLHQRVKALLHTGTTGRRTDQYRHAFLNAQFNSTRNLLAD